ncbi:MAG: very short patch repair endonuclease, partial [Chloroflexi bacterium]|nr:very short patch repair endonuclease [Chloroflexota bacterium]
MAAVRREGTAPELALRRALAQEGVRGYRLNVKSLPGAPDFAFTRWRVAVFVDGAFWHGHPKKFPRDRVTEYWRRKIARNRHRDKIANDRLRSAGWRVLRTWDFEVESNASDVVTKIRHALARARSDLGFEAPVRERVEQARRSQSGER